MISSNLLTSGAYAPPVFSWMLWCKIGMSSSFFGDLDRRKFSSTVSKASVGGNVCTKSLNRLHPLSTLWGLFKKLNDKLVLWVVSQLLNQLQIHFVSHDFVDTTKLEDLFYSREMHKPRKSGRSPGLLPSGCRPYKLGCLWRTSAPFFRFSFCRCFWATPSASHESAWTGTWKKAFPPLLIWRAFLCLVNVTVNRNEPQYLAVLSLLYFSTSNSVGILLMKISFNKISSHIMRALSLFFAAFSRFYG